MFRLNPKTSTKWHSIVGLGKGKALVLGLGSDHLIFMGGLWIFLSSCLFVFEKFGSWIFFCANARPAFLFFYILKIFCQNQHPAFFSGHALSWLFFFLVVQKIFIAPPPKKNQMVAPLSGGRDRFDLFPGF